MSRGIDKPSKSCVPGLLAAHEERYKEAQDTITRLQSEVERLRGRLNETSSKADALSYALVHSMTDKQFSKIHSQFCELQDCLAQNSESAQRLRQQADELEHPDGRS